MQERVAIADGLAAALGDVRGALTTLEAIERFLYVTATDTRGDNLSFEAIANIPSLLAGWFEEVRSGLLAAERGVHNSCD